MYKHAISWRASFVERPVRAPYVRPQLHRARAIAAQFRLASGDARAKFKAKNTRTDVSNVCEPRSLTKASARCRQSPGSCVDGKLQAELNKYLAMVLA